MCNDYYISPLLPNVPYPSLIFKAEMLSFGVTTHYVSKDTISVSAQKGCLTGQIHDICSNQLPSTLKAHNQASPLLPTVYNSCLPLLPQTWGPDTQRNMAVLCSLWRRCTQFISGFSLTKPHTQGIFPSFLLWETRSLALVTSLL